jgi:hypothetical protein
LATRASFNFENPEMPLKLLPENETAAPMSHVRQQRPVRLAWGSALSLFVAALIISAGYQAPVKEFALAPDSIVMGSERLFYFDVERITRQLKFPYVVESDAGLVSSGSNLELYENGLRLGPPHTPHQTIRDQGGGAYSHWHRYIYFSASDSSDPRSNGRLYTARVQAEIPFYLDALAAVLVCLGVAGLACLGRRAAGLRKPLHLAPTVAVVATTGLVAYLIVRGMQPNALWITPDSPGYFAPAVSALSGGPFIHLYGRQFLYSAFIFGVTALHGDLLGVVYGQLMLYVLMLAGSAVVLYLTVLAAVPDLAGSLRRTLAALATCAYVLLFLAYSPTYIYSFTIMAETLYTFVGVTAIIALLACFHVSPKNRWFPLIAIGGLLVTWANVMVKPHWLLVAPFLTFFFMLRLIFSVPKRTAALILTAAAVLIAGGVFAPERYLARKYDSYTSTTFGPRALFCYHSNMIADAYDRDQKVFGDVDSGFAATLVHQLRRENATHGGMPLLGFNGDRCFYGEAVDKLINDNLGMDEHRLADFFIRTFLRALWNDPAAYASKLLKQMEFAATRPFPNPHIVVPFDAAWLRWEMPGGLRLAPFIPADIKLEGTLLGGLAEFAPRLSAIALQAIMLLEHYWLALVLGSTAVVLAGVLIFRARVSAAAFILPVAALASWFLHCFLVGAIVTLDITRYLEVVYPLVLLGILALVSLVTGILWAIAIRLLQILRRTVVRNRETVSKRFMKLPLTRNGYAACVTRATAQRSVRSSRVGQNVD